MTHDELLAKIVEKEPGTLTYSNGEIWHSTRSLVSWQLALRAVVELLKDYDDGQTRVNEEFNQGILALSNVIKEAIEEKL